MGTNYYYKPPDGSDPLHIGKSSAGWCFSLHVCTKDGPQDLEQWQRLWAAEGSVIEDEYGRPVTAEQMLAEICDRSWNGSENPVGYANSDAFDLANHSVPGPNGLHRHAIGPPGGCIAHGAGTYDLVVGDFT